MLFHSLDKYRDRGLLILRIGIGVMFMYHGFPKLAAGPEGWIKLGGIFSSLGAGFVPGLLGFLAALSEFGGGLLLILGFLTRPACLFLWITMVVATVVLLKNGGPFAKCAHALEAAVLFFSLLWIGPGKISFDEIIFQKKNK